MNKLNDVDKTILSFKVIIKFGLESFGASLDLCLLIGMQTFTWNFCYQKNEMFFNEKLKVKNVNLKFNWILLNVI